MSIQDTFSFDKDGEVVRFPLVRRFFLTLVIILIGLFSFGLGRLSGQSGAGEMKISYDPNTSSESASTPANAGAIIASSQGKKYYYSGCANNISDKNKITFTTSAQAESAGYTLASGCKGSQ
jgi:hypothetical protein